jgi:hypothetical protein
MIRFDNTKSLQELEHKDWGEPNFESHVVQECHRLRRIPLKEFTTEDLRIMIGQNIGLDYLIPMAVDKLKQNPLAEGNFYPGDLLVNVLRAKSDFWLTHSDMKTEVSQIVDEAFEIPSITQLECEAIRDAYILFLRVSASPQKNEIVKPKTFIPIAAKSAAEQRTIVAHSASYGFGPPPVSQAPAGATESHGSKFHFSRPIRGLNRLGARRSHGCHRGLLSHATPWLTQINPVRA